MVPPCEFTMSHQLLTQLLTITLTIGESRNRGIPGFILCLLETEQIKRVSDRDRVTTKRKIKIESRRKNYDHYNLSLYK